MASFSYGNKGNNVSDYDVVKAAFKTLRQQGINAHIIRGSHEKGLLYRTSWGAAPFATFTSESIRNVVDLDGAIRPNQRINVQWQGDPWLLMQVFKDAGLIVSWNGSEHSCIQIVGAAHGIT